MINTQIMDQSKRESGVTRVNVHLARLTPTSKDSVLFYPESKYPSHIIFSYSISESIKQKKSKESKKIILKGITKSIHQLLGAKKK